jgi:lipopolysaccharide export LptBFGC system permease protein LptF
MKPNQLLVLIILIIIAVIGTTSAVYSYYKIKGSVSMPMKLIVSEKLGFTTETEMLNFGEARPGDTAIRIIEIKNPNNMRVKVNFFLHGQLAKWVQKEPIYLNNYEAKNITISAKIPENAEKGTYEGVLRVLFNKAD